MSDGDAPEPGPPGAGALAGLFAAVVERSRDAVVVLDRELRVVYASPSARHLAGPEHSLEAGTDALRLVHPEDVPVLSALADDQLGGADYLLPLRFRIVRAPGDVRTVEAVSIDLTDDPAVGGLVVQLRDVTLADHITPAEYRHERRFQRMLEHIADAVVLLDPSDRIITSSGAARSVVGHPGEVLDVDTLLARCHPAHRDRLVALSTGLPSERGERFVDELTFGSEEEGWRTFEVRGFNYVDDPVIGALVIIGRDVTAERAAEEVKAAAHREVLRSLDQRRGFVATVSHELRTPIHGILGLAELLTDPTRAAEVPELARLITSSAESLLTMVDDILDLSRLEIGRLELVEGPVDLVALVAEVTYLFRPRAADRGLLLTVDLGEGIPDRVRTDALRVRQVLSNLLSNAVRYTDAGSIVVRVGRGDVDGEAVVQISVSDTGIGLAPDVMETIFEPFAQVRPADARRAGGAGLGLAVSRRLSEALGGSLAVESEQGVGSTFTLVLPARVDEGGAARPGQGRTTAVNPGDAARTAGPPPVVLVVEDDPTSQFLVEQQLAKLGCACVTVPDGESVVEAWARVHPALVLMDDRLPGIDGREATVRLRAAEAASPRGGRVPVAALTASAVMGDDPFTAAGVDEVLTKPVRLDDLRALLERRLAR